MSTETSKGKLTNKDTNESLAFSLNPTEIKMSRAFDLQIEPCLGAPAPVVSFRCGGATQLSFNIRFDKDADNSCDPTKVDTFLKSFNQIKESTRSAPKVEFQMGNLKFVGYLLAHTTTRHRFDDKCNVTCLTLDATILSSGEYENE